MKDTRRRFEALQRIFDDLFLGEALTLLRTGDCFATLHRSGETGDLWCVAVCEDGHQSASSVGREASWSSLGAWRCIFGLLPPGAASVHATTSQGEQYPARIAVGAFLTAVPLEQEVLLAFLDAQGEVVNEQTLEGYDVHYEQQLLDRERQETALTHSLRLGGSLMDLGFGDYAVSFRRQETTGTLWRLEATPETIVARPIDEDCPGLRISDGAVVSAPAPAEDVSFVLVVDGATPERIPIAIEGDCGWTHSAGVELHRYGEDPAP